MKRVVRVVSQSPRHRNEPKVRSVCWMLCGGAIFARSERVRFVGDHRDGVRATGHDGDL
jgi:hypothetical protein